MATRSLRSKSTEIAEPIAVARVRLADAAKRREPGAASITCHLNEDPPCVKGVGG
jgi:hypothetical protein